MSFYCYAARSAVIFGIGKHGIDHRAAAVGGGDAHLQLRARHGLETVKPPALDVFGYLGHRPLAPGAARDQPVIPRKLGRHARPRRVVMMRVPGFAAAAGQLHGQFGIKEQKHGIQLYRLAPAQADRLARRAKALRGPGAGAAPGTKVSVLHVLGGIEIVL